MIKKNYNLVFVVGAHIIQNGVEVDKVEGEVAIIYFSKVDLSKDYAKQIASETDCIFLGSIEKVVKRNGNFSLGNYTVNIRGSAVEIGSFRSEDLLELEEAIEIRLLKSDLSLSLIQTYTFKYRYFLFLVTSFVFIFFIRNYLLFSIDPQERANLFKILFGKEVTVKTGF